MLKNSFIIVAIILCLATGTVANAYVASSTNFRIETDVVSYGGGLSTSTNFTVQDSISDRHLGISTSTDYKIESGPLPMRGSTISVSDPGLLNLGKIGSLKGGTLDGSVNVTVITDNSGGYQLKLSGTALSSGANHFGDFSGPSAWSVPVGTSLFGFSTSTNDLWNSVNSTPKVIATEYANNQPSGTVTTIKFRAQSNQNTKQAAGSYSSSITLTALPL